MDRMTSCKEISKLITDMNYTAGSGRPSRNSQGIYDPTLQLLCKVVWAKHAYVLHVCFHILYVFFITLLFI